MSEWFERWFGEEYLRVYLHRDDRDAERLVEFLAGWGIGGPGERLLDLACGTGRHTSALTRRGASVVGFDLSRRLLREARGSGGSLVRGDMRSLPFADGRFDAVLNLFTSFGYFADDSEHQAVLREVARVLAASGRFVLDFLNAPAVRAGLVPRDERRFAGTPVVQERAITGDGRYVTKRISIGEPGRSFTERVRLYERAELEVLLSGAGLRTVACAGDYDGSPHGEASPRLVLLGRRA